MALIPTKRLSLTGDAVEYFSAHPGGDTFLPGTLTFLSIGNGEGDNDLEITLVTYKTFGGLEVPDQVIVVPPFTFRMMRVPGYLYRGPSGYGLITCNRTSSVFLSCLTLGRV